MRNFSLATPYPMNDIGHRINTNLWHSRLSHPSNSTVSSMLKKFKISVINNTNLILCQSCLEGKSVVPLQVVHTDLWDPAPCQSIDGYKYNVVFVDECT